TNLLRELLTLVLAHRNGHDESPRQEEYWVRFPEHVKLVSSLFPKLSPSGIHRALTAIKMEKNRQVPDSGNVTHPRRPAPVSEQTSPGSKDRGARPRQPLVAEVPARPTNRPEADTR